MLDLIERRVKEERLTNVVTVLGSDTDPSLPAQALDVALMVDVYHELKHLIVFAPQPAPAP